jgi:hypothetical protein
MECAAGARATAALTAPRAPWEGEPGSDVHSRLAPNCGDCTVTPARMLAIYQVVRLGAAAAGFATLLDEVCAPQPAPLAARSLRTVRVGALTWCGSARPARFSTRCLQRRDAGAFLPGYTVTQQPFTTVNASRPGVGWVQCLRQRPKSERLPGGGGGGRRGGALPGAGAGRPRVQLGAAAHGPLAGELAPLCPIRSENHRARLAHGGVATQAVDPAWREMYGAASHGRRSHSNTARFITFPS